MFHSASSLHAGLIQRSRPVQSPPAVRIVAKAAIDLPTRIVPAKRPAAPSRRFGLTVRVEPELRRRLLEEKRERGTTQQDILHKALAQYLGE